MTVMNRHRVLANLPSPLAPMSEYLVRTGAGFDLYITDGNATSYKLNGTEPNVFLTQAQYDALPAKDPNTLYHITG